MRVLLQFAFWKVISATSLLILVAVKYESSLKYGHTMRFLNCFADWVPISSFECRDKNSVRINWTPFIYGPGGRDRTKISSRNE